MVPGITHIFVKNYMKYYLKNLLEVQELKDIISCVLLIHMKYIIRHNFMMASAVLVIHSHQIQKQNH